LEGQPQAWAAKPYRRELCPRLGEPCSLSRLCYD
jgi:hypothetical protein